MVNEPKIETNELETELSNFTHLEIIETQSDNVLYPELDAYWFLLNPQYKLFRFIYHDQIIMDSEDIKFAERFRPILLIHGFRSSYKTWNWMVQQLWADGFRNIFAMELHPHTRGLPKLYNQLTYVIEYILSILPNYKFITILGHSMGGMIARYYLKQESEAARKIRLCGTFGSPHHGILHIFKLFSDIVIVSLHRIELKLQKLQYKK